MYFGTSTTKANVTSWAEDEFVVVVPEDATSGKITLNISTQKNVNTPDEFTVRQHATLTEVSPVEAYKGATVTIKGTNFGTDKDGISVLFGGKAGEVLSCTEETIEVKVPMDAAEGAIKVTVETPYELVDGDLDFTVTTPVVANDGISPLSGYIGSEVTITGTKMPANTDDMVVKFGETIATIDSYTVTSGNGTLKVKVPSGLSEGNVTLTFTIAGLEIASKTFNVLPTPVVTTFDSKIVRIGQDITLTGTNFVANVNDVSVSFNGEVVNPTSISSTTMTVKVPAGATDGKLTVTFTGIPAAEVGSVTVLTVGDITSAVLKNSVQPFIPTDDYVSGEWATPVSWSFDPEIFNAIQFPSATPTGLLTMQVGWGQAKKEGNKMYQVVTLPQGTYKFELNVAECGTNKGRFGVVFGVTKGNATLPGLVEVGNPKKWIPDDMTNFLEDNSSNQSYYRITDTLGAHQKTMEVVLTEETEVTIGFVMQLNQEGWVKLSSVKVALIQ